MKSVLKPLLILLGILSGLYIVLFVVFFFDLDGKALFYGVEPFLKNHYDRMKRKDPLDMEYRTDTEKYEY
jgi:predicted PurR-regulated permease PerM